MGPGAKLGPPSPFACATALYSRKRKSMWLNLQVVTTYLFPVPWPQTEKCSYPPLCNPRRSKYTVLPRFHIKGHLYNGNGRTFLMRYSQTNVVKLHITNIHVGKHQKARPRVSLHISFFRAHYSAFSVQAFISELTLYIPLYVYKYSKYQHTLI